MNLTFLGGADEVGASSLLVEIAGRRVLVDCGIRPSPKAHAGLAADQLPDLSQIEKGAAGGLDALLVTHAHTDHTGALELVLERFPQTPVYATAPTLALTRVLHQDSRRIMQSRLDEEGELPLFDDIAAQRLMEKMIAVPFRTRLALGDGLDAVFFPAGHIAGAAMIGLESAEGNILISGDISISPQRTVDGARPPAFHPDVLIMESTYGGRLHANRAVEERKLVETVAQVTAAGGKVLIPAFALGRAQEILLILSEHQRRGQLPAVPIWADGMVRAVCQAYSSFGEALPLALQERGAQFFDANIRPVASNEQRSAILWEPGPAVIVASSGMLAGGPSLSYARALAAKPENAILLTGYQDEEAPGRRLQELSERGAGSIRLGAERVDVQCRIAAYALSAHADESQIINMVETLAPEHVVLVHGDASARASLEKAISARKRSVHLPLAGQSLTLAFARRRPLDANAAANLGAAQAQRSRVRREHIAGLADVVGKWVVFLEEGAGTGTRHTARCLAVAGDHLWVEAAPGLEQAVYPEAILALLDGAPDESDLAAPRPVIPAPARLEPNQALAAANQGFPPEARLRKSGYRLADFVLTLTFDFPDAALETYAGNIAELARRSGWQVQVTAETNQSALNALVREVLPQDWQVLKGPAIYRDQKRVAVTVTRPAAGAQDAAVATTEAVAATAAVATRYKTVSGWELSISAAAQSAPPSPPAVRPSGGQMEINAAFKTIRAALEGSTLYRTSLKDGEILLSFISAQVGERYRDPIAALADQTGWPLRINPQPNQGAILETAQVFLTRAGWAIRKSPSIYPEKSEVSAALADAPAEEAQADLAGAFEQETGFRLALTIAAPTRAEPETGGTAKIGVDAVEIPLKRIRLNPYQQSLTLDPERLEKAVERARRMGISPPLQVRRLRDSYALVDGLYRLRAAEALGLERVPAVVE